MPFTEQLFILVKAKSIQTSIQRKGLKNHHEDTSKVPQALLTPKLCICLKFECYPLPAGWATNPWIWTPDRVTLPSTLYSVETIYVIAKGNFSFAKN